MTGKLFISYRRDDSAGHAGRLRDRLEREFGPDLLFMDVDAIPLGLNFIKVLRDEVAKCDILLAVIGPNWTAIRDKNGNRRLDDKNDFVRIEIGTALTREIPVIPVLLDGAEIPKAEQLPSDLEELAVRNGLYVRHASFHGDMDRLIAGLKVSLKQDEAAASGERTASQRDGSRAAQSYRVEQTPRPQRRWPAALLGAAGVLVAVGAVMVVLKKPLPWTPATWLPATSSPPASQSPPVVPPQPAAPSPPPMQQTLDAPIPAPHKAEIPPAPPAPSPAPVQPPPATPAVVAPPKPVLPPAPPVPPVQPPQQREAEQTPQPVPAEAAPTPPVEPVPVQPTPKAIPKVEETPTPVPPVVASREHTRKPGESFKDCENCPEMVVLPAGSFVMGSPDGEQGRAPDESPQHVVTIAHPFAAGKFEITVDQFTAFANDTKYDAGGKCLTLEDGKSSIKDGRSWRDPGYPQSGSHPVACVSWNDARAYLSWLSKKTGKDYRLLTEAEWEYAARATTTHGSGSRYSFGDDDSQICRYGNVADRTARQTITGASGWTVFPCSDGYAYAAPVGIFAANAFELYDLLGNVWEWTQDCYNSTYSGAPSDGAAWTSGDCEHRVIRGGMWGSNPASVRSARRFKDQIASHSQDIGFRVARSVEE
jgi:formylglycine-generating enzyme required for sulfatase activity